MTQVAHSNWGGGKGRGIKCDDNLVAALCIKCHYDIDQGATLSKIDRQSMWLNAHRNTIKFLVDSGQWLNEIPIPLVEY